MSAPSMRRSGRGFTLVEVLIAVIITALIAVILFLAFQVVNQVRERQAALSSTDDAAVTALNTLSRDMVSMVQDPSEDPGFVMYSPEAARGAAAELIFTVLQPRPDETDLRWQELERVEYKVDKTQYPTPTLVRCSLPLTGPGAKGPVVTNMLVRNVAYFTAEVFDGEAWKFKWDTRRKKQWPQAAKLKLRLVKSTRGEHSTRLFLPRGNPIRSSFVRGTPGTASSGNAPE